nr:uncharacterized protein LOC109156624 [Ipomoea batatas]
MSNIDRSRMYQRRTERGDLNKDFIEGVETFIEFACSKSDFMDGTKIRCPCKKCYHTSFEEAEIVRFHLCKFGFVPNYFEWNRHGEMSRNRTSKIWTKWNEVWNSEKGKNKTELAKKNRRGGVLNRVAQSTHTTGSTPHVKVAAQLEGQLGHYPSYYELFKHTHTKQHDGETFIVEKAKQIHEQVATQREMLTGTGEQVDDNQLYYDVVGGHDKKRRIYGLGSYGCSVVNGSTSALLAI